MSDNLQEPKIDSAAVSDRGLNERRPLNEDSYLLDGERRIFAVADGVGGAEAGEVASKTAVEVLDEAFRHQVEGTDIEDLMELAIQRANASIHQMARDHARLANMATTIVTLHLDGNVATIGHVGDSRLYRMSPDGKLFRETEDHSIVEEEVRAGRMTPEQAINHPSKNVISRALGAEETVEVDLKTIQVEDGTSFLLCSDGITRHIPDNELRLILLTQDGLPDLCEELKRKCFERGAEDNLTAVLVRVGDPAPMVRDQSMERTLQIEHPLPEVRTQPIEKFPSGARKRGEDVLIPASRVAFPAPDASDSVPKVGSSSGPINIANIPPAQTAGGGIGRSIARFFVFLLFVGGIAVAFYYGTRYRGALPFGLTGATETVTTIPPAPEADDPVLVFEKSRRSVDLAPADWLRDAAPREVIRQGVSGPMESKDPHFLYLYGRALLLTGSFEAAAKALEQAIAQVDLAPSPENSTIRKDAVVALAAASLKLNKDTQRAVSHIDELMPRPTSSSSP
jgi:serine/threonine protein phosphatase PrpC